MTLPHTATLNGDSRYDVIIVNTETGIVSSIAGYSMRPIGGIRQGAQRLMDLIGDNLNPPFVARIVLERVVEVGQQVQVL